MKEFYQIIQKPVVTEKATERSSIGQYVFWVDPKSNKKQIKEAVEEAFSVKVTSVNTNRLFGKIKRMGRHAGRRALRKKAYVTLKEGDSIKIFEGV
ncbi:MAG: 50S ribosomal protein L23 [Deltaproteobacteria bacterium]|nr:50S ribosomal protein L23 [Deltaproteobacteria bacterium]